MKKDNKIITAKYWMVFEVSKNEEVGFRSEDEIKTIGKKLLDGMLDTANKMNLAIKLKKYSAESLKMIDMNLSVNQD